MHTCIKYNRYFILCFLRTWFHEIFNLYKSLTTKTCLFIPHHATYHPFQHKYLHKTHEFSGKSNSGCELYSLSLGRKKKMIFIFTSSFLFLFIPITQRSKCQHTRHRYIFHMLRWHRIAKVKTLYNFLSSSLKTQTEEVQKY